MIGHHITNICEKALALTSDLHVRKAQYSHPSRMEHILLTMMEYFPTFMQAGTHPAHNDERLSSRLEHILLTMMKDFCTYIHPGGNISFSQ